jgi:hypothetical protein
MSQTISSLVQSQFPEFVQEDYPALIAFIEAYYQYLELEKNPQDVLTNLIAYTDIDRTLDEFVSKFEKTYLNGLPLNVAGDKRMFMKHVNDLYNTKGTEESFRLLFRLLFNEEIELYYPKQQMLVPSSGVWVQNNSIMVTLDAGISPACINKKIKIYTNEGVINTYVKNVVQVTPSIYELYIDKSFSIPIQPGNRVSGVAFNATAQQTITGAQVISAGAGFHIGQVFNITSVNGSGTKIKVTRVDANGGIKRVAFIQFGTGYEANFQISLAPSSRTSGPLDPYQSYTNGFIEQVLVTKVSYFGQDYSEVTYSGEVIGSSYSDDYLPDNAQAANINPAIIQFTLGALCAYRGEYSTADGFLSDINMIQDGYLYQDFSYVIKSTQKIEQFANVVKKLVHPAGTLMFGELQLQTEIDVGVTYDYFKVLSEQLKFEESVTSGDAAITFRTGKGLFDYSAPTDKIVFATGKRLTDSTTPIDPIAIKTGKNLTDSSTSGDLSIKFNTIKSLVDLAPAVDSIFLKTSRTLADSSTPADAITLNTTSNKTDAVSATDSFSAFFITYSDATYFAGTYVGDSI